MRLGRRWLLVALALSFTGSLALRVSQPAVAFTARSLGAAGLAVGAITAVYFAVRSVASVAGGRLLDRVPRLARTATPLLFLAAAAATAVMLYAPSLQVFYAGRAAEGAALGAAWTIVQSVVAMAAPPGVRATVLSLYFAAGNLATPAANFIYVALGCSYAASMALSLLLFAAASALALALPWVRARRRSTGGTRGHGGWSLSVLAALLSFTTVLRVSTGLTVGEAVYVLLASLSHLGRAAVALLLGYATLAGVAASIAVASLADKLGVHLAASVTGVLASAGVILIATGRPLEAAAGVALLAAAGRIATPWTRRIAVEAAGGTGVGLVSATGNVGVVAGTLLAGWAADAASRAPSLVEATMAVLAALILVSAALLAVLTKQSPGGE